MTRWQIIVLVLVLLLSAVIRFYRLDQIPAGLYYDEVDSGYQARSLLQTGRDYRGWESPFFVDSFNSQRTPIPIYLTVVTTWLFSIPEVQVRAPSALFGIAIVALVYFLVRRWTGSHFAGVIAGIVFAVSPWQIQFSRFSHEGTSTVAVFLLGLLLLDMAVSRKSYRWFLAGLFVTSLGVYTYRTMSLFAPMALLGYVAVYWKSVRSFGFGRLFLSGFMPVLVIVPFLLATTVFAFDTPRIVQLAVTSDPALPIQIQRAREVDSGDFKDSSLGKQAVSSSFLFHNKPVEWWYAFTNNVLKAFSADFLFITGDLNLRHSIGHRGMLYVLDAIGLLAGFWYVVNHWRSKQWQWLSLWLLLAVIPASLTFDGAGHAGRLFIFSAPLLMMVSVGWWQVLIRWRKLGSIVVLMYLVSVVFYFHSYLVHYPVESARQFGYGFKQAMTKIAEVEKDYKQVQMIATKDPPILYYLFWAHVNPRLVQDYGSQFSLERNFNKPLDKYKVADWPVKLRSDTLYLITENELGVDLRVKPPPPGVKVIDVILYPDNETDFYLITADDTMQSCCLHF